MQRMVWYVCHFVKTPNQESGIAIIHVKVH